jgi:hypothetical protein
METDPDTPRRCRRCKNKAISKLPRKTAQENEMTEEMRLEPKPEKAIWDSWSIRQKTVWFEAHKQAILEDVQKMGPTETRLKWGISVNTWTNLKRRWGILEGRTYKTKRGKHSDDKSIKADTQKLDWGKIVLVNREVLLDYIKKLREGFLKEDPPLSCLGLDIVIGALGMMEGDVVIEDKENVRI